MIHFRDEVTQQEIWLRNDSVMAVSVMPYRLLPTASDGASTPARDCWRLTYHLSDPIDTGKGDVTELHYFYEDSIKAIDRAEFIARELTNERDYKD